MMLTRDFKDLLRLLNANAVDYVLIGGHAFDGDVPAYVISREDLIRNKLASSREQVLLDVKVLRKAERATKQQ